LPFAGILESILCDTCNPNCCDINFPCLPRVLSSSVNFERFTNVGLSPFPELSNFMSPPAEPGVYHLLINLEPLTLQWSLKMTNLDQCDSCFV
jgi:hypothetical protein